MLHQDDRSQFTDPGTEDRLRGGNMVERGGGVEAQAVESAAGPLEAAAFARMMPEGVPVEAGLLRPNP